MYRWRKFLRFGVLDVLLYLSLCEFNPRKWGPDPDIIPLFREKNQCIKFHYRF